MKYWKERSALLLAVMLVAGMARAQLAVPSAVTGAGVTSNARGLKLNWTLGETAVFKLESGQLGLRTGIQQVASTQGPTAIAPTIAAKVILFYPNPVINNLTVEAEDIRTWQLYNTAGQDIGSEATGAVKDKTLTLDLTKLPAGVYLLQLNDTPTQICRFIKH